MSDEQKEIENQFQVLIGILKTQLAKRSYICQKGFQVLIGILKTVEMMKEQKSNIMFQVLIGILKTSFWSSTSGYIFCFKSL